MSIETIRLTGRGKAFLIVSCILIGLSFVAPTNDAFLSLLVSGLSMILLIFISYNFLMIKARVLHQVEIQRIIKGSKIEKEPHQILIRFKNPTAFPIYCSEITDNPPETAKIIRGSNNSILVLPPKGISTMSYWAKFSTGEHKFKKSTVLIRDPLSLLFVTVPLGKEDIARIFPKIRPIIERRLWRSLVTAPFGMSRARVIGAGHEFADIREYVYGDDFRKIEWKSTARTGKLMVKDHELEAHLRVIFILDATKTMLHGVLGNTKLEYSIRAVAAISKFLLDRGDQVALTIYMGENDFLFVPMLKGRGRFKEILQALSRVSPKGLNKSGLIEAISKSVAKSTAWGKNLIILISDLENCTIDFLESLAELAFRIRSMKNDFYIISPYTPLFEEETMSSLGRIIYRIYAASSWKEREKITRIFERRGISVLNVGPRDIIDIVLKRIEEMRPVAPV